MPRALRAQASWDFTPTGTGQVALSAGESVVVTDRTNEKRGWVIVRKASGETGNTPFGYLKMLAPEPPAALPPAPAPPQDTPPAVPADPTTKAEEAAADATVDRGAIPF